MEPLGEEIRPAMSLAHHEGRVRKKSGSASAPYATKIIKAGGLVADAKTLLFHWDVAKSAGENVDRIRRENVLGKVSRSRVEDILAVFRQRYVAESEVTKALVVLVKNHFPTGSLERVLYFHAARADSLLHDVVTEVLMPMHARGISDIEPLEIQKALTKWVESVQLLLQQRPRRKLGQVGSDADTAAVQLQQLDLFFPLIGAQDQADRWLLAGLHLVLFQPAQVELHLPFVGGRELADFEIHGDQPSQRTMIKKQVDVVILVRAATMLRSGKTSANWIMRRRLFSAKPVPNSTVNSRDTVATISSP
jgi:hypothetical protein